MRRIWPFVLVAFGSNPALANGGMDWKRDPVGEAREHQLEVPVGARSERNERKLPIRLVVEDLYVRLDSDRYRAAASYTLSNPGGPVEGLYWVEVHEPSEQAQVRIRVAGRPYRCTIEKMPAPADGVSKQPGSRCIVKITIPTGDKIPLELEYFDGYSHDTITHISSGKNSISSEGTDTTTDLGYVFNYPLWPAGSFQGPTHLKVTIDPGPFHLQETEEFVEFAAGAGYRPWDTNRGKLVHESDVPDIGEARDIRFLLGSEEQVRSLSSGGPRLSGTGTDPENWALELIAVVDARASADATAKVDGSRFATTWCAQAGKGVGEWLELQFKPQPETVPLALNLTPSGPAEVSLSACGKPPPEGRGWPLQPARASGWPRWISWPVSEMPANPADGCVRITVVKSEPGVCLKDLHLKAVPSRPIASAVLDEIRAGSAMYRPEKAFDKNAQTAWAAWGPENWLLFRVKPGLPASLDLYAGCPGKWHKDNNRPKAVTLELSNGFRGTFPLEDAAKTQHIDLSEAAKRGPVAAARLSYGDVYPGEKFDDTCITEIDLKTTPGRKP